MTFKQNLKFLAITWGIIGILCLLFNNQQQLALIKFYGPIIILVCSAIIAFIVFRTALFVLYLRTHPFWIDDKDFIKYLREQYQRKDAEE